MKLVSNKPVIGIISISVIGCNRMVGWVLRHINRCRLFKAKSIFYENSQFYFKQFSLAWVHSFIVKTFLFLTIQLIQTILIQLVLFTHNDKTVLYITIQFNVSRVSMSKTVPFQTIQFSMSTQFKCKYCLIVNIFLFQAIQFSQTVLI